MERRNIPGTSPFENVMGYCRAVVVGSHVYVAGTAPIPPDGSAPPEDAYDADEAVPRDHRHGAREGGRELRARRSLAHLHHRSCVLRGRRARPRRGLRRDPPGEHDGLHRSLRPRAGRSRSTWTRFFRDRKQAFPPSITGKGAVQTGSVLDHAFGQSDPYTLGVEEEYQLLDGRTFDLVQHIETMLDAIAGHELEGQINPELMQSVIEITTPVCRTAGDVLRELTKLRAYVTEVAGANGLRVGSAGTHPFSLFERQRITAKDRYRALIDQMQYVARRELIFGMHVHVAVDDPEKAIKVVNGLLPQLGPLLALSASSPFWRGEATGLASSRQMVFSAFPRSGPAAALPRLLRLRGRRRPARAFGLHRRLHAHLVGHPPPPEARHRGGPDLRRGDARRGRGRDRRVLPGAREAALGELRRGRGDPLVPPHPHEREQVARGALRARGAGDGPRDGPKEPRAQSRGSSGGR